MLEKTIVLLKVSVSDSNFEVTNSLIQKSLKMMGFDYEGVNVMLSEEELKKIYLNLDTMILNSIFARLAYRELRAFLVSGDNAVYEVFRLKGIKTEPLECDSSSWRYELALNSYVRHIRLFGLNDIGIPTFVTVVDNFIHAPGREDVERNLEVFKKYFGQI